MLAVFHVTREAAVCGFEMRTEDGRVVKAVAKEKELAKKEHEQAIQQGRMTGLVEHVTDDVFTISLGCLPQLQMITTKLTYIMDLLEDDFVDQIRFQLPVSVGARYGQMPSNMIAARTVPTDRITISVDIFMKGAILNLTSPTHPSFNLSSDGTISTPASVSRQRGWYHSPSFLAQDFVLSIKSEGLALPRCFAERSPTGTVAMQLTVVPQFKFPSIPAQEYIFLVDRSGSMRGDRTDTAKRALVMLLRSLPSEGTTFNIASFGNRHTSLWPKSKNYSEETLKEATQHVDSMIANYGGTDIRTALEHIFNIRQHNVPTSCFVLTDGEAWNVDAVIATVTKAASEAKAEAPLRVFTLGIGETTSSAMCNGIARAGNGICLMAATSETIIAKCSKLVKASRTDILNNVTVDWHIPPQPLDATSRPLGDQSVVFRQGPRSLPPLYAGTRFISFAIIKHEQFEIPHEVVVQATRNSTGELFTFTVPVEVLDGVDSKSGAQRPLIHNLAARRIIRDLEDREKGDVSPAVKSTIIHLGEQYQLASRFTSFVAVEDHDKEKLDSMPLYSGDDEDEDEELVASASLCMARVVRCDGLQSPAVGSARAGPPLRRACLPPASHPTANKGDGSHTNTSRGARMGRAPPVPPRRTDLEASERLAAEGAVRAAAPAPPPPTSSGPRDREFAVLRESTQCMMAAPANRTGSAAVTASQPRDDVELLVRLQSFDGSFSMSAELMQILGRDASTQGPSRGVDEKIWVTILAIVYLRKHLQAQPELLEGLEEKATSYVERTYGQDFSALLQAAESLVV
ncbi:hypothetical protein EIP86_008529 [Pleurotus ostreatoroseus]|nr:hypothetical protein EIP86_008529 [Pleurotus ostreatoroseus]